MVHFCSSRRSHLWAGLLVSLQNIYSKLMYYFFLIICWSVKLNTGGGLETHRFNGPFSGTTRIPFQMPNQQCQQHYSAKLFFLNLHYNDKSDDITHRCRPERSSRNDTGWYRCCRASYQTQTDTFLCVSVHSYEHPANARFSHIPHGEIPFVSLPAMWATDGITMCHLLELKT